MNDLELVYRNLKYIKKTGNLNEVMKDDYNKALINLGLVNDNFNNYSISASGESLINLLQGTYDKW